MPGAGVPRWGFPRAVPGGADRSQDRSQDRNQDRGAVTQPEGGSVGGGVNVPRFQYRPPAMERPAPPPPPARNQGGDQGQGSSPGQGKGGAWRERWEGMRPTN